MVCPLRTLLPNSQLLQCEDRFSLTDTEEGPVSFWSILCAILSIPARNAREMTEQLDVISVSLRGRSSCSDYGFLLHFIKSEGLEERFFSVTWPGIIDIAMEMPALFPTGELLALTKENTAAIFTRRQIACLVVHQFLCTIPLPSWCNNSSSLDFRIWFPMEQPHPKAVHGYLSALFCYFERITMSSFTDASLADWPVTMTLRFLGSETHLLPPFIQPPLGPSQSSRNTQSLDPLHSVGDVPQLNLQDEHQDALQAGQAGSKDKALPGEKAERSESLTLPAAMGQRRQQHQAYFSPLCLQLTSSASTHPSLLGLPRGACVISANKCIGFGRTGTQEETHVGCTPEACTAVLLTPPLEADEVLVMEGAEAMAVMEGYGREAHFVSALGRNSAEEVHASNWRRRTMLFMDALELDTYDGTQCVPDLLPGHLERELLKAYTAFSSRSDLYEEVATGLWGCGSFCGDAEIKTILQWAAASLAGVPLLFICSDQVREGEEHTFSARLKAFVDAVRKHDWSVPDVLQALYRLSPADVRARAAFAFVVEELCTVR